MKEYQLVGYALNQTSAITDIVSTRIYHGLRPEGTIVPCINYYEVGSVTRISGIETAPYSINCRASSPNQARDLARLVVDLFHGTSGTGIQGTFNGFSVARASLRNDNGLIPEPDDRIYNAPVDIQIVYTSDEVT